MTPRPAVVDDHEPTERDRLLPAQPANPPHPDGYLDPDDPAVSPYNLWTVRFLRSLTLLLLAITFIWWVLLLVSIFVSPPGLHTRGSGFFDFSYTSLSLGLLLVQLLFFSNPSMAMRVGQGVISVLLLVDLIVIVSVQRIRHEEGPPGIASVVWVVLIGAWCVLTDRVVAWGKREEEERLTGRAETKRTLKEWLGVLTATVILAVYALIAIFMTATLVIRSRDATLELDGERIYVDGGKYQVHFNCVGNITTDKHGNTLPTVLLESAEEPLEYDFDHWVYHALQDGAISRYCYWDRPGYGFSDNAPSPHSAGLCADNLAEALAVKGEKGPWVLVSAGYGSIVSRIFSARNSRNVAGIMLIDPLHEDLLVRDVGNPYRGFVLWGWGILSPLGIQRIIGSIFQGQTREDRVFGPDVSQGGKFIKAQLQENLVAASFSRNEIASARTIQAADTPLVVVSSGLRIKNDPDWKSHQKDLTNITGSLLSWDVVDKAPHYVWQKKEGQEVLEKRLKQLVKAGAKQFYGL
jgi:pimeloyl-ACP methyl ester carboxylesterase